MAATREIELELPDATATRALAVRLSAGLKAGQTIWLSGPIGAGKTEFARALIRARAGSEIDVPSPSFTLIQTYDLPDIAIAHVDLYRLGDSSELVELGLDDLITDHLCLIEWPERAEGLLPDPSLALRLALEGTGRRLSIQDNDGIMTPEIAIA